MSTKIHPHLPIDSWVRQCQECGHVQTDRDPSKLGGRELARFLGLKCTRCRSESLDYGKVNVTSFGEE